VRLLFETGELGSQALEHFGDFVRFSLALQTLDGRGAHCSAAGICQVDRPLRYAPSFLRVSAAVTISLK
jgi:hypothetical protein